MEHHIYYLINEYSQLSGNIVNTVCIIASPLLIFFTLIFYIVSDRRKINRDIYYERLKILRENVERIFGQFVDCGYHYDEHYETLSVYETKRNYAGKNFFEKCVSALCDIFDILESEGKLYAKGYTNIENSYNGPKQKSIEELFYEEYNQKPSDEELKSKCFRNAKLSYVARFFDIKEDKEVKNYWGIKNEKDKIDFCIKILRTKYGSQIDGYFHRIFLALEFLKNKFNCSCKNGKNLAEQIPFQMSKYEIKLLFYYCAYSDKIQAKVKKYGLLQKYITTKDLISEKHIIFFNKLNNSQ